MGKKINLNYCLINLNRLNSFSKKSKLEIKEFIFYKKLKYIRVNLKNEKQHSFILILKEYIKRMINNSILINQKFNWKKIKKTI